MEVPGSQDPEIAEEVFDDDSIIADSSHDCLKEAETKAPLM